MWVKKIAVKKGRKNDENGLILQFPSLTTTSNVLQAYPKLGVVPHPTVSFFDIDTLIVFDTLGEFEHISGL